MTIQTLDDVTEFPLTWPDNKPRAAERISGGFKTTMARAQQEIREEMPRWRARAWVLSMAPQYRQGQVDPGVALWWSHPVIRDGDNRYSYDLRVLACDTYLRREDNLHAIALTLERLRSLERYGTYSLEQAIEGARLALPPPENERAVDWRKLFDCVPGLPADKQLVLAEHTYRMMSRDTAGDQARQRDLNAAIAAAREELAA